MVGDGSGKFEPVRPGFRTQEVVRLKVEDTVTRGSGHLIPGNEALKYLAWDKRKVTVLSVSGNLHGSTQSPKMGRRRDPGGRGAEVSGTAPRWTGQSC